MIADLLIRYRWVCLLFSVTMAIMLASGLARISFDTRISVLLGDNDPYVSERDQLAAVFPGRQTISIALVPVDPETGVFSASMLEALGTLHREYRAIPYTGLASSVVAYDSPTGEIGLFPGRFRNFHEISDSAMQAARTRAMTDRFINGVLVSPGEDLALFTTALTLEQSTSAQNREIAAALETLLSEVQATHPEVRFYAGAEALFETSTRDAMIQDLTRLLPMVIFVCVLLICYCFQSVRHGACILLIALVTVSSTVGALAWLGLALNSVSVMAPLVVVIIAVANTAHLLSIYRQQHAAGDQAIGAMLNSIRFNLRPVSLAALTTAIGFFSLNYASAPAISQFGSIVALGVLFAWTLSFLMFPALVLLAPVSSGPVRLATGFIAACQRLQLRHDRRIFYGVLLAGTITAALLPLNKPDFNRLDFISQDSPLHAYYEVLAERMQRGTGLAYGVLASDPGSGAGDTNAAITPEFLRSIDAFSERLRQREDVLEVVSLVDVVKTVNDTLTGSRAQTENNYRIPDSSEEIEEHLMSYRSVQRDSYALNNFVTDDLTMIRLFITTTPLSNQQLIDLDVAIGNLFQSMNIKGPARLLHGSNTLLFARMDRTVTIELMQSYLISLVMITLTLTVGLRSLYYGLLSVIPNLLPATMVFGIWGLLVGSIDPFVMMLCSISIGLVVDDTVHILSTYQRQRQQGTEVNAAIHAAITRAGPALTITTAVMALGTLILLFASTLYFQQAARLLVPIIVLALILDLTFLPSLLARLEARRRQKLAS